MNTDTYPDVSLWWLRAVLWCDVGSMVLLGLAALAGSTYFAYLLGIALPTELIYVRLLGIVSVCWGLLLFLTVARPMRNVDVLRITILLHLFVVGTIIFGFFFSGVTGVFSLPNNANSFWIAVLVLNALFAVGLGVNLPHPLQADFIGKKESSIGWKHHSHKMHEQSTGD